MSRLPNLYHRDKHGRLRIWRVWTEGKTIHTQYGLADGELQTSAKDAASTNVGRANVRDPEQQAEFEAQSMWTFKKERKYSETPEEAEAPLLLPMLAKPYNKKPFDKDQAYYIQRKFDGCRTLSYLDDCGDVVLLSRSGKPYTVPHISEELKKYLPPGTMLDGELYAHGVPLQTIISWVKKNKPESAQLQYIIYDVPIVCDDDTLSFTQRLNELDDINLISNCLVKCETVLVSTPEEAQELEQQYVSEGYEGAIVRKASGLYQFGYRSSELIKFKSFQDDEFEVVDCIDGVGKFVGHAVFVCKNNMNDNTFKVVPLGSMEQRKLYFDNKQNYIGQKLTIKFFNRTSEGIPFLPVGKCFRPIEDL